MNAAELIVGLSVNLDGQPYVITALNSTTRQATLRTFHAKATIDQRIDYEGPTMLVSFDEIRLLPPPR